MQPGAGTGWNAEFREGFRLPVSGFWFLVSGFWFLVSGKMVL
jgi:hypothetical protein